jgi:hypothetical protein
METKHQHFVVWGAGFGGLTFCQTFNQRAMCVALFDRQNSPVNLAGIIQTITEPKRFVIAGITFISLMFGKLPPWLVVLARAGSEIVLH